ncbi:MAG: hypothetical protein JXR76_25400 [Deltaproteobacteria bacterium]|nr:hypothetical protein [Deltaproteobacteria bacterium]
MIWGNDNVAGKYAEIEEKGYDVVLGFNEPNKTDQADMSVEEAIELWPLLTANPNIRVGSPAVSDNGRGWLEDFMLQVEANDLRVDFMTVHWYGWNAGSCDDAGQLAGALNWASQWGRPLWITEFGCMIESHPDEQTVMNFFKSALNMMKTRSDVERYAWYPWNTYSGLSDRETPPVLTPLGEIFAAAPAWH